MKTNNSKDSQRRLQEAMNRLMEGKARNCAGKLTKTNLAREADVSQATLYRAKNILAEWTQRVSESTPRNAQVTRLESELTESRKRIRDLERQNTHLRRQVTFAATVIAELSVRVTEDTSGRVVPIRATGAPDSQ